MDLHEAMERRHAVRLYTDEAVDDADLRELENLIGRCNAESGLHCQMAHGLDNAFCGHATHYGRFRGVHNAVALIGPDQGTDPLTGIIDAGREPQASLQTRIGYFGERICLGIVQMNLETCWAVLDDPRDGWWSLIPGERLVCVLSFGHGARAGGRHHSKPLDRLCAVPSHRAVPGWFREGVRAASLAPTSLSEQPFVFVLHEDDSVSIRPTEGLFAYVGAGCARCHFEIGAGGHHVRWRGRDADHATRSREVALGPS